MWNSGSFVIVLCALLALAAVPALANPAPACLYAVSKDMCGTRLYNDGKWDIPYCADGTCFTLSGQGATFSGGMASSAGTCGEDPQNPVPCDEAPDFGDFLEAKVDLRAQRHTSCKARGYFAGPFNIVDQTSGVTIAQGDLNATLGVGTHRPACSGACDEDCETCHDARRLPDFSWQIGSEGFLDAQVIAGPYAGCRLKASFQGEFIADGDSRGPQIPNYTWGFCGTLEGVLECPCPASN